MRLKLSTANNYIQYIQTLNKNYKRFFMSILLRPWTNLIGPVVVVLAFQVKTSFANVHGNTHNLSVNPHLVPVK